jgi:2-methylfumaryl-CoA hydratase
MVDPEALHIPPDLSLSGYDAGLAGSPNLFEDYVKGETILPIDGMTIEEAEHQIATRLFQNTARGHFDAIVQKKSRFGRRIVYGGHVLNIARSLSFNGLENGCFVAAINGGRHAAPAAAGDTLYCGSQVLETYAFNERSDIGALRIRSVVCKDRVFSEMPDKDNGGVLLDFDYWLLIPRRGAVAEHAT